MTKAQIHEKHGIYRLMPSAELNRELSTEEAEQYEKSILISKASFEEYWDEDFSGDID